MGPCEEVGRNPSPISLSGMGVMARQLSSRSLVPNKWLSARTKHCCCSPYPGRMHPAGPSESFYIPHFICLKERLICDVICLRGFNCRGLRRDHRVPFHPTDGLYLPWLPRYCFERSNRLPDPQHHGSFPITGTRAAFNILQPGWLATTRECSQLSLVHAR